MLIIVFWYSFFVLKVTGSLVTRLCPYARLSAHWCFNWYPSNSSVCRLLRFSLVLISKLPPNLFLCRFRSLQMKLRRPLRTTHSTFVALQSDMNNFKSYVMLCPIWYHLYNIKNVKNIHGEVLLLVSLKLY